ncbi:hypothetical protein FRC03_001021 [Tulasnella sp. 419]|nr:hypothetical protein FRC03_001021 [Tulasnella sp. 419]
MQTLQGLMQFLGFFTPRVKTSSYNPPNNPFYQAVAHSDITGIGVIRRPQHRSFLGGYSNVYEGTLQYKRGPEMKVAIKVMRFRGPVSPQLDDKDYKRFYMEVLVSSRLGHPHIAEFKGFTMPTDLTDMPAIISLWYQNGHIMAWLEKNLTVDRLSLLRDVISGVRYLHSRGIVHGDLKAANVLIDDQYRARLCDFGMSHLIDNQDDLPSYSEVSLSEIGCTLRFSSPELQENEISTFMSDMWASGCVATQILANEVPYANHRNEPGIRFAILKGEMPVNIAAFTHQNHLIEALLGNIAACWRKDPRHRPSSEHLLGSIDSLMRQGLKIVRPLVYKKGDV